MKSYFKYTTGEAFTLNGEDYSGFFNLWKGFPITGKIPSSTSAVLSSKGNMLANSFLRKRDFDRTAFPIKKTKQLIPLQISPRDIIDQTFLNKNLNILNHNNLNLFGLNVIAKTNLIDFENTPTDGSSYFLGVTSSNTDTKNNDTKLAKNNSRSLQIDPFAATNRLPAGLNALDSKVDGALFVNDDKSYKYLITTNTNSFTFSGSFAPKGSLTLIDRKQMAPGSKLTYNDTTGELQNVVCLHGLASDWVPVGNIPELQDAPAAMTEEWWERSPLAKKWLDSLDQEMARGRHLPGVIRRRLDKLKKLLEQEIEASQARWIEKWMELQGKYGTPRDRNKVPGNRPVGTPWPAGQAAPTFPPDLRFPPGFDGAERAGRSVEWWDPRRQEWIPNSQEPMPDPWPFWWEGDMPSAIDRDGFPMGEMRRGRGWVPLPVPGGRRPGHLGPMGFGLEAAGGGVDARKWMGEPEPAWNRHSNLQETLRRKKILLEFQKEYEEILKWQALLYHALIKIKKYINSKGLFQQLASSEEERRIELTGILANSSSANNAEVANLVMRRYLHYPTFSTVNSVDTASLAANILGTEGYHSHNDGDTYMPCYSMEDFVYLTDPVTIQEEISHVGDKTPRKYLINTYDFKSFASTNEFQLKDQIAVTGNIVDGKIKVGKNIMGTLHKRGQEIELSISNRYSKKYYTTIVTLGVLDQIVDFDIRDTDDNILILTQNLDSGNTYGLYQVDTDNVLQNSVNFNADETGKGKKPCKCKNEIKVHYLKPNGRDLMLPPDDLNDIGNIPEGWTIEYGFNPSDEPEGLWWRKEGKHCWYRTVRGRADGEHEVRYYCRESINMRHGPIKRPQPDNREWEWDKGDWGRFRMGDGAGGEVDPEAPEKPKVIYTNPVVIIIGGGLDEGEDQIFIPVPEDDPGDEIIGLPPANADWHKEIENWEEEWPDLEEIPEPPGWRENNPLPGTPIEDIPEDEMDDQLRKEIEESQRHMREWQLEEMLRKQLRDWLDTPLGEDAAVDELIEGLMGLDASRVLLDSAKGPINRIDTGSTDSRKTKIQFSNTDSNEYILTDNGVVSKGFISNPTFPSSMGSKANLLYPPGAFWGTTEEEMSDNQLKWNTDSLKSNNFNNLNIHEVQNQTDTFTFIHNIGRIYLGTSKTLYNNLVPLDLDNNYSPTSSPESSLGISLNSQLQSILKDTLNVFYNLNTVIKQDIVEGIPILQNYAAPKSININLKDFEFHENEEISYTTVSRVFNKLYQLQLAIYNTVLQIAPDEPTEIILPGDGEIYDSGRPVREDPGPSLYDIYSSWTAPIAHLRYQKMGLVPWPWPPGADISSEERAKMLEVQAAADRNMDTGPWPVNINEDMLNRQRSTKDTTGSTSTGSTTPTTTTGGAMPASSGY